MSYKTIINLLSNKQLKSIVLICLLTPAIFFITAEIATRILYRNINSLYIDHNIFLPNAYGPSHGLKKESVGYAYDAEIITDKRGFRIKSNYKNNNGNKPSVIFMGDSITFGIGVKAENTFPELFHNMKQHWTIYNSAVIGYEVRDYKNFADYFIIKNKERLNIKHVILGYCLNDILSESSGAIQEQLEMIRYNNRILLFFRRVFDITGIDYYLRGYSRFYSLVKYRFCDVSKNTTIANRLEYNYDSSVTSTVNKLQYICSILKENNIYFTVILLPYEYQLREGSQDILFPQIILKNKFDLYNISYIDTYDALNKHIQNMNFKPKDLFLFNDPMHLSENGHKIVAEILNNEIKEIN